MPQSISGLIRKMNLLVMNRTSPQHLRRRKRRRFRWFAKSGIGVEAGARAGSAVAGVVIRLGI